MLFFYSFSVQHQIYFAAVTDAITYALNINGDCDKITKKKKMDSTTNYIVRQIEQLIFFGHFYDAEHLTNIS